MDVKSALERIAIAPKDSPILVLTCGEKDNVQCCFANTIESKKMVNQPNVIGVFDKSMDLDEVKSTIKTKVLSSLIQHCHRHFNLCLSFSFKLFSTHSWRWFFLNCRHSGLICG